MVAVVVALVVGWMREPEPLSADEAAAFTSRAFAAVGIDGEIVGQPVRGEEAGRCPAGGDGCVPPLYDVWQTTFRTDQGSFELSVIRAGSARGQANLLRDFGPDGQPVLSDEQFEVVDSFSYDPPRDDWRLENLLGLLTALGVVAWSAALWRYRPHFFPAPRAA